VATNTIAPRDASLLPNRDFFASFILARAEVSNPRLYTAFVSTPREAYVGPGPWFIYVSHGKYLRTPNADPVFLYQDVLVALDPQRGINNGEPTLHARCIHALGLADGEQVLHIGAGTGYYTAILARMVGAGGQVDAFELDAGLAAKAAANLGAFDRVRVHAESATGRPLPQADAIYVNAGASHPDCNWLQALRPDGRLVFPLTSSAGYGGMLLVQRRKSGYAARFLCGAGFIPCEGARDHETGARLAAVFAAGGSDLVRALHLDIAPDTSCWFAGNRWWLSTDECAD
jgi:protein-L-isoaspartate(D-aspartate) O-methyltransferase